MPQIANGTSVLSADWNQLFNLTSTDAQKLLFYLDPRSTTGLPYQRLGFYSVQVQEVQEDLTYWLQVAYGEIWQDGFWYELPAELRGTTLAIRMRARFLKAGLLWRCVYTN
jgi:hypothetical protein